MVLFRRMVDIDTVGFNRPEEEFAEIEPVGFPVLDRPRGIKHVGLTDHVIDRPEAHFGHEFA